jgi:crotonobetaine/carnitine-CoA ligase
MADTNYHELLELKAKALGDKVFLRFENDRITYKQMDERANRVANALFRLGAGPGVGVANMLPNSPETLYTHFAIQKLGAYSVPVNTELKGEHLSYILDHSEAKILVTHNDLAGSFRKVREQCPKIAHVAVSLRDSSPVLKVYPGVEVIQDWLEREPPDRPAQTHRDNDIALIMYTSGTTGRAKGVVYRYGRVGLNKVGLAAKAFYKNTDVLFTCLPLFHANALYVSLPSSLWAEASLALGKRFSASRFWDEVRGYGATVFNALGAMIPILMKQPEKPNDGDNPVRLVLSAACPAALWEKFEKRFNVKIIEFYGAVDGGGNAVFNLGNAPVGSIGKLPRPNAKVVDENMNEVPAKTPGELVFQITEKEKPVEYFKNTEATEQKQRGGWLHTGDLVYRDENDFLYFVDRKSDNMRRRGENISSYEVERIVEKFPSVLEAAAYAIKAELTEDDVMIAVLPKPGETVDPDALYDFCVDEMPRYMVPRYIRVVDSFEKTETHRVVKGPLKEQGVTPDTWDEEKVRGKRK